MFNQIHEIVFHGKGGYNWETVYDMPVWLRNFTFNKIDKFYAPSDSQNNVKKSIDAMKSAGSTKDNQTIPTYVTRASKK